MRTTGDRDRDRSCGAGGGDVVLRVADVDVGPFTREGLALRRTEPPAEHGVHLEADVRQAGVRVGLVLGGHHERATSEPPDRRDRVACAGQQGCPGDAELRVQLAVAVGRGGHLALGHPERQLVLEHRAEPVDDDRSVDGVTRLGRQARPASRRSPASSRPASCRDRTRPPAPSLILVASRETPRSPRLAVRGTQGPRSARVIGPQGRSV